MLPIQNVKGKGRAWILFREYAKWSTWHGIPHVGSSKNVPLRAFWILIVVITSAIFLFMVYNVTTQYLQYPVNTVTTVVFDNIKFPAVTVCSTNPYKVHKLNSSSKGHLFRDLFQEFELAQKGRPTPGKIWGFDELDTDEHGKFDALALEALATENLVLLATQLSDAERVAASQTQDELIVSCTFNLDYCNESHDGDISQVIDPYFGQCYTFNNPAKHNSTQAGPTYGLRLVVQNNMSDFTPITLTSGFRVILTTPGERPIPMNYGSHVPPGTGASIGVKFATTQRLPPPYGSCTMDPEQAKTIYKGDYTVEGCQHRCIQEFIIANCTCCDPRFACPNDSRKLEICTFPENLNDKTSGDYIDFVCMRDTARTLQTELNTIAMCDCPLACKETSYTTTISAAGWPAANFEPDECYSKTHNRWKDKPNSTDCHVWYEQNTALLEVYYESLSYQAYNEDPSYTTVNLVSDIGGNVGLFMGASVLTVVEVICLLVMICCNCDKEPKTLKH